MLKIADVRALLNGMSPAASRAKLGDLATAAETAAGWLKISGMVDGERRIIAVTHSSVYAEAAIACTAAASFVGQLPVPVFSTQAGYTMRLVLSNFSATGFQVEVEFTDSVYLSGDDEVTITWTRSGASLPQ